MSQTVLAAPGPKGFVERRCLLWSGDLGTVSEASDWSDTKHVLIKRVGVNEANAREVYSLLRTHCSLRHPHIVELLQVVPSHTRGEVSAVLERPDTSLWQFLIQQPNRALNETLARWFFQQVIVAVHFCHGNQHWLRNIRLENILLKDGEVLPIVKLWAFVYDLNIARSHDAVLDYLAPECVDEGFGYDVSKADIWSCGVLLFTMLCGSYPFTNQNSNSNVEGTPKEVYRRNLEAFFFRGGSYPDHLSPSSVDLLRQLLTPRPQDRITVDRIFEHDWFTKNFPTEARDMNDRMLEQNEKMSRIYSSASGRDEKIKNVILHACCERNQQRINVSDNDIDQILEEEQAMENKGMSVGQSCNNRSRVV